jgi:hypothetical protein
MVIMFNRPILDWPDKRSIWYVRHIVGVPTVVKKKKNIKTSISQVKFRDKVFTFDISKPAFRWKNYWYYLVDIDSGQMWFGSPPPAIAPELLDAVLVRKLGQQLVSALETASIFQNLVMILVFIGLGIAIGYIMGNFVPMP